MRLSSSSRYLLDVNVLIALTDRDHVHHQLVRGWFYRSSSLQWTVCAFTEAGFLRIATAPRHGSVTLNEATAILKQFARHPGYHYRAITADWHTLSEPFASRLYGTKQVTDAYLLGLAVLNGLVLVTMDKAMLHLAGKEHANHVLLLSPELKSKS